MISTNGYTRTAKEAAAMHGDQSGKVFLITGAHSGIGVETAKALLSVRGKVILAGRNPELVKEFAANTLIEQGKYDAALIDADGPGLDLGDLASVRAFAEYVLKTHPKVDVLINNAGVMATPAGVTKDGFELQVGTNVVGHYLLAKLLLPITSRQVWVSSEAHAMAGAKRFDFDYFTKFQVDDKKYSALKQYQQSKLGDILLAKDFPRRNPNLEAVSLHPGVIHTNLARHLPWIVLVIFKWISWLRLMKTKTPEQGAATTVTCATLPHVEVGAYYDDCEVGKERDCAKNEDDAKRLYDLCDELTKKFQ